jgi:hypothetical protein
VIFTSFLQNKNKNRYPVILCEQINMSAFIKSMSKRSKRGVRDSDVVRFSRVNRTLVPKGDLITKRLTATLALSSSVGGVIPVTAYNTAQVQSDPAFEWASFAARYQQFRVKGISVTLMPYLTEYYYNVGLNCWNLAIGDYLGTSVPANFSQVLADENIVLRNGNHVITHAITWARNPNAKLWNPTSAALPAANNYGICLASLNSNVIGVFAFYSVVIEWDVEFRGAQ